MGSSSYRRIWLCAIWARCRCRLVIGVGCCRCAFVHGQRLLVLWRMIRLPPC